MSNRLRMPPRIIAVLKLPKRKVPLLIVLARNIVQSMSERPWFPSPRPPLATVADAIEALAVAQAATYGGGVAQTAVRNRKEADLRLLLEQLCGYVQSIADADVEHARSVIESAGMYVKGARRGGKLGFRLHNLLSGEVEALCDQAADRASYEWEISLDERVTWAQWDITTEANTKITGLPPGARVWVRYRSIVKSVKSDWSEPAAILVT